jgi:rod shape determining protein RodA
MYQHSSFNQDLTLFQKIRSFDYTLLICILLLGLISGLSMYSTDGGQFLFHSKNHVFKFLIFFPLMILLSFLNIKFGHFCMELKSQVLKDG